MSNNEDLRAALPSPAPAEPIDVADTVQRVVNGFVCTYWDDGAKRDLAAEIVAALPRAGPIDVAGVQEDDLYLITKGGAYYRPNAQGYTRDRVKAGRFTLAEAVFYSHPNGPNGPRDGIGFEHLTPPASAPQPDDLSDDPGPALRGPVAMVAVQPDDIAYAGAEMGDMVTLPRVDAQRLFDNLEGRLVAALNDLSTRTVPVFPGIAALRLALAAPSVPDDNLREQVGKAIYHALYGHRGGRWNAMNPRDYHVWYETADRYFAALAHADRETGAGV